MLLTLIKNLIGKITKPCGTLLKHKKSKTIWCTAEPEEFFWFKDPFSIWLYQRIEQNKFGKWERTKDFICLKENKIEQREELFEEIK